MGDTGYNHGALTHLQYNPGGGSTDIDGIAVADGAVLTSDAQDLDVKALRVYSAIAVEDNTGACDGNVYLSVLASDLDPDSEGYQAGPTTGPVYTDIVASGGIIDPVQNQTRRTTFTVSGAQFPKHKVHVLNDGGQELAITINYVDITIPAAS